MLRVPRVTPALRHASRVTRTRRADVAARCLRGAVKPRAPPHAASDARLTPRVLALWPGHFRAVFQCLLLSRCL